MTVSIVPYRIYPQSLSESIVPYRTVPVGGPGRFQVSGALRSRNLNALGSRSLPLSVPLSRRETNQHSPLPSLSTHALPALVWFS